MDEAVLKAMARWPDVPAAWGWLRLDRRGRWVLVDRGRARATADATANATGNARGNAYGNATGDAADCTIEVEAGLPSHPIEHAGFIDFIARNYRADDAGRWHFQNGPQRVYVDLDLAPLVLRVSQQPDGVRLVAHTGAVASRVERLAADAEGVVWAVTDLGPGALDDRHLATLLAQAEEVPPDAGQDARQADAATSDEALGRLRIRLHGGQALPIEPLAGDAAAILGFVRRPRPAG